MQAVDETVETVHVYVVREEDSRPATALPLCLAALCLVVIAAITFYSCQNPAYTRATLLIPAQFFTRAARVTQAIVPTGMKVYPATIAHGTLTITNGSIIAQIIPVGFTIQDVATDIAVYVPAGNANGYGYATVPTHALISGTGGDFATLSINAVTGSSVYIRNLTPFTGGSASRTVKFITSQDVRTATTTAKLAALQAATIAALQFQPCRLVAMHTLVSVTVTATCPYVRVPWVALPSNRITGIRLRGHTLVLDVLVPPTPVRLPLR